MKTDKAAILQKIQRHKGTGAEVYYSQREAEAMLTAIERLEREYHATRRDEFTRAIIAGLASGITSRTTSSRPLTCRIW